MGFKKVVGGGLGALALAWGLSRGACQTLNTGNAPAADIAHETGAAAVEVIDQATSGAAEQARHVDWQEKGRQAREVWDAAKKFADGFTAQPQPTAPEPPQP